MKSRDERRADFERREAERKAKYAERTAALQAKHEQRMGELRAEADEVKRARAEQQRHRDDAVLEQAAHRTGDGMPIAEGPGALFVNLAEARQRAQVLGAMWRRRRRGREE